MVGERNVGGNLLGRLAVLEPLEDEDEEVGMTLPALNRRGFSEHARVDYRHV